MLILHGGLVADAHRSVTTVPAQARLNPLLHRVARHDAVDRTQFFRSAQHDG